jgi:branched-chain amino acid transport system substrate-binding protein
MNRLLPALAVLAAFAGPLKAQAPQSVVIGLAGPLTGGSANAGKDNENGARLAIEDLNRQGLTIGGKRLRFELNSQDDQGDPKQATIVAQRFCDANVAGVVGHYNSGATIPASRFYRDCGLPLMNASSSSPAVTRLGFETTFRIISNDEVLGEALARHAVKVLNAQRIVVIDDRTAYGQAVGDQFAKAVQAYGGALLARQYASATTIDFSPVLTAVKAQQADLVFYGGLDVQGGPLLRQMRELGIGAKLMGTGGLCTAQLVKLAGEDNVGHGVICTTGGGLVAALPGGAEFERRYRAAYNAEVQAYAPFTYDAVMVLVDAMKRAGSIDPKQYRAALSTTDYNGVTGRIRFNEQGDIRERPVMLITFEGSRKVLVGEAK